MKSTHCFGLLLCAIFACVGTGCASVPASTSIDLRVVDEITGQPLRGVVATASWVAMSGTYGGVNEVGIAAAGEGQSDDGGNIHVAITVTRAVDHGQLLDGPTIWLYKRGYRATRLTNVRSMFGTSRSDWNGEVAKMQPLNTDDRDEEYKALQHWSAIGLAKVKDLQGCAWKSFPITLRISMQERQYFLALGKPYTTTWADGLLAFDSNSLKSGCGSTKAFLEGLLK